MLDISCDVPWMGDGDPQRESPPGPLLVDRVDGDVTVVRLFGEHDLRTRDALRRTLFGVVADDGLVVLDLSGAEYIDSCVLNAAVDTDSLLRERGARLVLQVGSAAIVDRALEVSGLAGLLPCAHGVGEAVALARSGALGH